MTTIILTDEERAVVADWVGARTASLSDEVGPLDGLKVAADIRNVLNSFEPVVRLAEFGEAGGGQVSDELLGLLEAAEPYYAEGVDGDRAGLERVNAATDPEGWCGEGQTLDDVRAVSAQLLAEGEQQLACIRAILERARTRTEVLS